jgi:hypothetical protein
MIDSLTHDTRGDAHTYWGRHMCAPFPVYNCTVISPKGVMAPKKEAVHSGGPGSPLEKVAYLQQLLQALLLHSAGPVATSGKVLFLSFLFCRP